MSRSRSILILALLALLAPAAVAVAQAPPPSSDTPAPSYRAGTVEDLRSSVATKDQVIQEISCGQTVNGQIETDDFQLDDGSYFDFYEFTGQNGQTVTIDMKSNAVDPYLFLLDADDNVLAEDDDSGTGNDARIVFTLDETSDAWAIAANAFDPGSTGPYTLSLQCSGGPAPGGFFMDPEYPDFRFRVVIDAENAAPIFGSPEANCIPDTACVSGALPGRSELFIRILGPRPNGFLWPTLVRFTPSQVVVEIEQISTGILRTYVLEAIPPGTDELPGLQDRTGFLP